MGLMNSLVNNFCIKLLPTLHSVSPISKNYVTSHLSASGEFALASIKVSCIECCHCKNLEKGFFFVIKGTSLSGHIV